MSAKAKLITAMAFFGTISLFTRSIPLAAGQTAFYRALIALAVLCAYNLIRRKKITLSALKGELLPLFLSGAAMGFNWILLFEAYERTSVSIATLSYYFAPVIVMIASPLLFHEKPDGLTIFCFAMCTIGLVFTMDLSAGEGGISGALFGLGAAVLYASVILFNKHIKNVDGVERTILQFAAALIVLTPYVALTSGFSLAACDTRGILSLLTLGVVHTGVMYCLYFSSLRCLPGQQAAILSYIDPLVAVGVSVLVLHEPLTPLQLAGGILLLGFTLLYELMQKRSL